MDQPTLYRLDVPGIDPSARFFHFSWRKGDWAMAVEPKSSALYPAAESGYNCYLIDPDTLAVSRGDETWKAFPCDPLTGLYLREPDALVASAALADAHPEDEHPHAFTVNQGDQADAPEAELVAEISENHRWLKVGEVVIAIDDIALLVSNDEHGDTSSFLLKSQPGQPISLDCPVDQLYALLGQTGIRPRSRPSE
jgi:hypothetical protein